MSRAQPKPPITAPYGDDVTSLDVGSGWLADVRRHAASRFMDEGLPQKKWEHWRYTNLSSITTTRFAVPEAPAEIENAALAELGWAPAVAPTLVFVDGHLVTDHSQSAPQGVEVASLSDAAEKHPEALKRVLGRGDAKDSTSLAALNGALLQSGVFVYATKNTEAKTPVHVMFVSTGTQKAAAAHPRIAVLAEPNSGVTVLESYVALEGAENPYWTNAVVEMVAEPNARITHLKLQQDSAQGVHAGAIWSEAQRDATVRTFAFVLGGGTARNDVTTVLAGSGAFCEMNGLYVQRGSESADFRTVVDHAVPHCDSKQLYKGVLDDKSTGSFSGTVLVREQAQKTNAEQTNRNLLLSEQATANTKPQMEIYADDVKCAHGATVGQLDDAALFYLRSRGLDPATARRLLTYAFASEVVEALENEALEKLVLDLVQTRLEME